MNRPGVRRAAAPGRRPSAGPVPTGRSRGDRRTRRTGPGRRAGSRSAIRSWGSTSSVGSSSVAPVPSGGCSQPTSSAVAGRRRRRRCRVGDQPRTTGIAALAAVDRERGDHPVAVPAVVLAAARRRPCRPAPRCRSRITGWPTSRPGNGSSGPITSASGTGVSVGQVARRVGAAGLPRVVLPQAQPARSPGSPAPPAGAPARTAAPARGSGEIGSRSRGYGAPGGWSELVPGCFLTNSRKASRVQVCPPPRTPPRP